ncbi:hypothetical protein [Pukyongia salina]|nr:hypothetical protein [Pukyongia salina]
MKKLAISGTGKIKCKDQVTLKTTSASAGNAGTYNFLGLAGFDLE